VAAEAEAHRGQALVGEVGLPTRREAGVQRGRQDRRRRNVDGGDACPSSFARVAHPTGEVREVAALDEGLRGQIKQPASAAMGIDRLVLRAGRSLYGYMRDADQTLTLDELWQSPDAAAYRERVLDLLLR
jgi:hypothetical protein